MNRRIICVPESSASLSIRSSTDTHSRSSSLTARSVSRRLRATICLKHTDQHPKIKNISPLSDLANTSGFEITIKASYTRDFIYPALHCGIQHLEHALTGEAGHTVEMILLVNDNIVIVVLTTCSLTLSSTKKQTKTLFTLLKYSENVNVCVFLA